MEKFLVLGNIKEMMECGFIVCTKCNFHTNTDYETDTTGDYERIKIFQNNNNQFMAEMYK